MFNATLKVLLGTFAIVSAATTFSADADAGSKRKNSVSAAKPFFMKVAPTRPHFGKIKGSTNGTQTQAAGKNKTFCGNGDQFTFYVEDENGKQVGPTHYGCTD